MREIYRIMDANLNRLREGLRVLEEISRFILDDGEMFSKLKDMRHQVTAATDGLSCGVTELLNAREAASDVGADSWNSGESTRDGLLMLMVANCKRVQEAARVLEEFGKVCSGIDPRAFKEIRFMAYDLEKDLFKKINDEVFHDNFPAG